MLDWLFMNAPTTVTMSLAMLTSPYSRATEAKTAAALSWVIDMWSIKLKRSDLNPAVGHIIISCTQSFCRMPSQVCGMGCLSYANLCSVQHGIAYYPIPCSA